MASEAAMKVAEKIGRAIALGVGGENYVAEKIDAEFAPLLAADQERDAIAAQVAELRGELALWKHGYTDLRRIFNGQCDTIAQLVKLIEPRDRRIDELEQLVSDAESRANERGRRIEELRRILRMESAAQ